MTFPGYPNANFTGDNVTIKITDIGFDPRHTAVNVKVQFYKNGAPITTSQGSQKLSVYASNVGGTSFKDSDSQWAVTQA